MNFTKLSFLDRKIIQNILIIVIILGSSLLVAFFSLRLGFSDIIHKKLWLDQMFWLMGIVFLTGFIFAKLFQLALDKMDYFFDNVLSELKNYLKGNQGEKKTIVKLQEILGQEYKIYKNFKIPNTKFDNDAVIVGAKGIISIEIKNVRGDFDFIGEETYKHDYHYGNECLCKLNEYNSPTREILRHCLSLEKWLGEKGFNDIKLKRAILLVDTNSRIIKIENPVVYVVKGLDNLAKYIKTSYNDPLFTPEFCERINHLFVGK